LKNYYVHHVPGRIRIKIPNIKYRPHRAQKILTLFEAFNGIDDVSVNKVTGSLVINYDPDVVRPEELLNALKENGYYEHSRAISYDHQLHKASSKAGDRIGKLVFGWAVGRALDASGMSFLTALI
jgi:hypothetical protein